MINAAVKEIPTDHISTAIIELEPDSEFGETYTSLRITYSRPETNDEQLSRLNKDRDHWMRQLEESRSREAYCLSQLDALPTYRRI